MTGLAKGIWALWLALLEGYLPGLLLSSIVPGVVLTLMLVIGGLGLYALVGTQVDEVHTGLWTSAPLLGLLAVAAILAVRPLVAVDSRRRMWLWGRSFGLGLLLMPVTAYALRAGGWDPWPPARLASYPSADREIQAHVDYRSPGEVWIVDSAGRPRKVEGAVSTQWLGWAPTGRTFYYLVRANGRDDLRCISEANDWKPQTVCTLGRLNNDDGHLARPTSQYDWRYGLDFAPGGRRFCLEMARTGSADQSVAVFDLDRHQARLLPVLERNGGSHWWIDDNHLAMAGDNFKVTVTELWPKSPARGRP